MTSKGKAMAIKLLEAAQGQFCIWDWPISIRIGRNTETIDSEEQGQLLVAEALRDNGRDDLADRLEAIKALRDVELGPEWPAWAREALGDMVAWVDGLDADIKAASDLADMAIEAIEAGRYDEALACTEKADAIENQYGDDPAYGPALRAVRALRKEAMA